eukprot:scaffold37325_cov67-Phaeocystis_antarctica.AAC.2
MVLIWVLIAEGLEPHAVAVRLSAVRQGGEEIILLCFRKRELLLGDDPCQRLQPRMRTHEHLEVGACP